MFPNTLKCPNCGKPVAKGANFCPECGARQVSGVRRCGSCGHDNQGNARFCGRCGKPLDTSQAGDVQRDRWSRSTEDFAARIVVDDLRGLLRRGLNIEMGTNAMILEHGANRGLMPPGLYTMDNILQRARNWITGAIPEHATALLVDVAPVEFDFHLGGRFTKDPLPVGVSVRMQVEVAEPGKFLINMLQNRERLSKEEMRQYLYPEVAAVADRWLRQHTLQELVDDPRQLERLELALEEALRNTFAQTGLQFLLVRTVELNLEPFEAIREKYARANLLDQELVAEQLLAEARLREAEQKARIDGEAALTLEALKQEYEEKKARAALALRQRYLEIQQQTNLVELAEETAKVEMEERKIELYQRMRQAVMSDKMSEVRSTADFEAFLDAIDREKLLRDKERQDLIRAWDEEKQDHEKARAHLLARLEVEQDYELRLTSIKLQREAEHEEMVGDQLRLDHEIELARKRADFDFEMKRRVVEEELHLKVEQQRIADEQEKNQIAIESLRRRQEIADDFEEARMGLELVSLMEKQDRLHEEDMRRIAREDELARARETQRLELERWEAQERSRQAERDHELRRIETMGKLGVEALIALSGSDQARILADLKQAELLQGMTEEQILAAAAKDSPEVARALQEKFRMIAEGKASEKEKELYERLLSEQKELQRLMREEADRRNQDVKEAWERSSARQQEVSTHAMDKLAETAKAFAQGHQSSPPIIVTTPGGPATYLPGSPGAAAPAAQPDPGRTRMCVKCGVTVNLAEKFCPNCGHKFEGSG